MHLRFFSILLVVILVVFKENEATMESKLDGSISNHLGAITVNAGTTMLEKGNLKLTYTLTPPIQLIELLCEVQEKLVNIVIRFFFV